MISCEPRSRRTYRQPHDGSRAEDGDVMAYKTTAITQYSIICDMCGKHPIDDHGVSWFPDTDDADFAAADMGWHRYEQPDGDPKHICPERTEKETMK